MATEAHVAYCFETLSARFEKRKPLSLAAAETFWSLYLARCDVDPSPTAPASRLPAINRLLATTPSTSSSSPAPSACSSTPSLLTAGSSSTSIDSRGSDRGGVFGQSGRGTRSAEKEFPLFVTWDLRGRGGSKSLRGCIGTFEAQELEDGLRNYALTSALEDTRFNPISPREFASLECGVTLLTDFEPVTDPMDWAIGTHGLRIHFTNNGRRHGSTYLPDVAREQGWTKEETIVSLMRKAGWGGHSREWTKVADLRVVRYQGKRTNLTYRQWRDWRDWVEETGRDLIDDV